MAHSIKRAAVIGAGTMGRQIAVLLAASHTPVLLLDMVPKKTDKKQEATEMHARNALANAALDNLKKHHSEQTLSHIQPGNMEDDVASLATVDWVIECVPEALDIKQQTYKNISPHLKKTALISSNTSTIPLKELKRNLPISVQHQLCIAHFFNPPSHMPLLEMVSDEDNPARSIQGLMRFADEALGRNVIQVKDTSGFIANRIGMFWLLCAMEEAEKEGLDIATADAVMNGAFGFPKTGVFALADLIGLQLIPEITASMCRYLPKPDTFCQFDAALKRIKKRIHADQEHPKFYHDKDDARAPEVSIEHWHEFLGKDTAEGRFARHTLMRTLTYTAEMAPTIADNILEVDAAMRDGYGWKYGPFAMMERLGLAWMVERLRMQELHVPILLKQAEARGFYPPWQVVAMAENGVQAAKGKQYLGFSGRYRTQKIEKDKWTLACITEGSKPIFHQGSAEMHDIGDGIACFSLTKGSMHVIDEHALELLARAVEKAEAEFQGMILGHDGKHFSAGLDLHIVLEASRNGKWNQIEQLLEQGQECFMQVKQSKVPIVAAVCGYTLGGGCELALHCAAVQAHHHVRIGLVETSIGVIPAWGGTKEALLRAVRRGGEDADKVIEHVVETFRLLARGSKSRNTEDAFSMGLLQQPSRITMHRERLLPDAKNLCLKLAKDYTPPAEHIIEVPVGVLYQELEHEVTAMIQQEHPGMTKHRCKTLKILARVLSGRAAVKEAQQAMHEEPPRAEWDRISESMVMQTSREAFMELVQEEEAKEKIKAVLE